MTPAEIREFLRNKNDVVIEPVATPEWPELDGQIFVRSLSIAARSAYLASLRSVTPGDGQAPVQVKVNTDHAEIQLAAVTMCTAEGEQLFELADAEWLRDKDNRPMQRIVDASARLNGFGVRVRLDVKNVSPSPSLATH